MITANIIHRVFRIKCGDSVGTGFTIEVDGNEYLVTARHVVDAFGGSIGLEVFGNGAWSMLGVKLVARGRDDIDVAVFETETRITPKNLPLVAESNGLAYGQDVYFLGFPFGVLSEVKFQDAGYPLPLVKKALMSSFAGDVYLLDGNNNPGFSGGPVVFGNNNQAPSRIAAVISGYRFNAEPIFMKDVKTDLVHRQNTGIIISYKIEVAVALVRENR